jgi:predicted amidohydrolase YtcJ
VAAPFPFEASIWSRVLRVILRHCEVKGASPVDVRVSRGFIGELDRSLRAAPGELEIEALGGALLPGLHDHHLHLLALGAALQSVPCGPPKVRDEAVLATGLARAAASASPGSFLRGVGYHEEVAGSLDRWRLDAWVRDVPLRVQHRSGALWMLNSAALEQLGLDAGPGPAGVERDGEGRATGRLFRLDDWLRQRLPWQPPDLVPVGGLLARRGVTGVTDAGVHNGPTEWALLDRASRVGALPQRLQLMGREDLPSPSEASARMIRGAVKIVLDEPALPAIDDLVRRIVSAHRLGRTVAVHCVTRVELMFALGALEEAGVLAGDRIEHAAVAPPEAVAWLARLGLTVVTQPGFLAERGDRYRRDVAALDLPWLVPGAALDRQGVPHAAGTDAPFGEADPWRAMRAAVDRTTASGHVLAAHERITPERDLALFSAPLQAPGGAPREIRPGAPADLCLLADPWARARDELSADRVRLTSCAGRVEFAEPGLLG